MKRYGRSYLHVKILARVIYILLARDNIENCLIQKSKFLLLQLDLWIIYWGAGCVRVIVSENRLCVSSSNPGRIRLLACLPDWLIYLKACQTVLHGCSCGVRVKSLDCRIVVTEFEIHSPCYVHFRTNALRKGMNLHFLPAIGKIVPILFFKKVGFCKKICIPLNNKTSKLSWFFFLMPKDERNFTHYNFCVVRF